MNKLENYRPCAGVRPITAKLLLLMLREITDDRDTIIIPQRRITPVTIKSIIGRDWLLNCFC